MTPQLEKIAREIEPLAWAALGIGDTRADKDRRTASLRKARAALSALLPPSEEMVEAMQEAIVMLDIEGGPTDQSVSDAFTAAINAILVEGGE